MAVLNHFKNFLNKLKQDSASWGSLAVLGISLALLMTIMMLFPYHG